MHILAFDCSTSGCSAVIADETGKIIVWRQEKTPVRQSETLIPLLADLLNDSGIDWRDIGLIGVTVGPGSFTGIRIGLATAQGLSLARNIPVIGVSTAEIFAHGTDLTGMEGHLLVVCIESKRTDLFFQNFYASLEPATPIHIATPEQIAAKLTGKLLFCGDGCHHLQKIPPPLSGEWKFSNHLSCPDCRILVKRVLFHHRQGSGLPPKPLYLRPPDVTIPGSADIIARIT